MDVSSDGKSLSFPQSRSRVNPPSRKCINRTNKKGNELVVTELCGLPRAEAESAFKPPSLGYSFPSLFQGRKKRGLSLDFLFVVVAPAAFEMGGLSGLDVVLWRLVSLIPYHSGNYL